MIKTKYAPGAKPNLAGTGDTSRQMPSVPLPAVDPIPDDPFTYMTETPDAKVTSPVATEQLPQFNSNTGYTDTGVSHSGDLGGA